MKRKLFPRIMMTMLGTVLILVAVGNLTLSIFGERASAVITHIRREGGERAESTPNRYNYNISYSFTLPDGKKVDGFTKVIGDAVYIKANGTGRITVRYFKAMPYINAPETMPFSLGQLILTGAGIFLIFR